MQSFKKESFSRCCVFYKEQVHPRVEEGLGRKKFALDRHRRRVEVQGMSDASVEHLQFVKLFSLPLAGAIAPLLDMLLCIRLSKKEEKLV